MSSQRLNELSQNQWLQFGTSIFSVMTQAAQKFGAVNLAQGFPDFDGPDDIKIAAIDAIRSNKNQYAPATGIPELRELISHRYEKLCGLKFDFNQEITVFSGATEALFVSLLSVLKAGDEVLAFAPFYDSYPAPILAAGAQMRVIELSPPDWKLNREIIEAQMSHRTKAILINTPNNPTGKVLSHRDMTMIAELANKYDCFVICDEVYEALTYEKHEHLRLINYPGMRERTITISSTSKTFSMTGWKVGYAVASPQLTAIMRGLHQFTVFCSATPLQWGMIAAFKLSQMKDGKFEKELRAYYARKRERLCSILVQAGFKVIPPEGSYFVLADYSQHSSMTDREFAMWMTEHVKVAAVPISAFFPEKRQQDFPHRLLRFAFCKNDSTLDLAEQRFKEWPR